MQPDTLTPSQQLRQIRKRLRLSRPELCNLVNKLYPGRPLTRAALESWENGVTEPPAHMFAALAEVARIVVDGYRNDNTHTA